MKEKVQVVPPMPADLTDDHEVQVRKQKNGKEKYI
jgi:hypothetical protein